jgi:hypothetical protein
MQVQNFECQIAQAQISRYLAGEQMDAETVEQLNEHVSGCTVCKAAIAERRAHLQDQLSKKPGKKSQTTKAVVESTPSIPSPKETVSIRQPEPVEITNPVNEPWTKTYLKPLLYSGGLAIVLVGMSLMAKNPTSIFGDRAVIAEAAAPEKKEASKPTRKPESIAPVPISDTLASSAKIQEEPAKPDEPVAKAETAPKPAPVVAKRHREQPRERKPRENSRPAPRKPAGVVIYDADGKVISPGE